MELLLSIIGVFLVLLGLGGLLVPFLPDAPLIAAGMIVILLAQGELSTTAVLGLLGLTLLTFAADWLLVFYGARKLGASREGTIGGAIGLLVGLLLSPIGFVAGIIVFPALGAILGELVARGVHHDHKKIATVGLGVALFATLSLVVKLILIGLIILIGGLALGL